MAAEPTTLAPYDFRREQILTKQRGLWMQAWQRLIRNRLALASTIILIAILVLSISADFLPFVQHHDPAHQDYAALNQGPSTEHFLGTDHLGRDLWARLLEGMLFSLKVGIVGIIIVLAIGVSIGMLASLGGRVTDGIVMWITDMAFAFPDVLAVILLRQVLLNRDWPVVGTGDPQIPGFPSVLIVTILAVSLVAWVTVARLVRGQMLSIKEQDYITAARAIGASQWRIVRVHMLPNTLGAVIVAATFGIPTLIFLEATLGYIGLGVPPPAASLGSLINNGLDSIRNNQWAIIWPVLSVATLMLTFTFLGDGLRDALDPRTRK